MGRQRRRSLALLIGTTAEIQNKDVTEEFEKIRGRVAAVVAYFPPTDLIRFLEHVKSAYPEAAKLIAVLSVILQQNNSKNSLLLIRIFR